VPNGHGVQCAYREEELQRAAAQRHRQRIERIVVDQWKWFAFGRDRRHGFPPRGPATPPLRAFVPDARSDHAAADGQVQPWSLEWQQRTASLHDHAAATPDCLRPPPWSLERQQDAHVLLAPAAPGISNVWRDGACEWQHAWTSDQRPCAVPPAEQWPHARPTASAAPHHGNARVGGTASTAPFRPWDSERRPHGGFKTPSPSGHDHGGRCGGASGRCHPRPWSPEGQPCVQIWSTETQPHVQPWSSQMPPYAQPWGLERQLYAQPWDSERQPYPQPSAAPSSARADDGRDCGACLHPQPWPSSERRRCVGRGPPSPLRDDHDVLLRSMQQQALAWDHRRFSLPCRSRRLCKALQFQFGPA
jgi:hypothetical protein